MWKLFTLYTYVRPLIDPVLTVKGSLMPLDTRKAAHMQAQILKSFQGRERTVVFVYLVAGSYNYVQTSVIFRHLEAVEPQIHDARGSQPSAHYDTVLLAPPGTSFDGLLYVAETSTASAVAVASAAKYQLIEALIQGMMSDGTHIRALLRRMR